MRITLSNELDSGVQQGNSLEANDLLPTEAITDKHIEAIIDTQIKCFTEQVKYTVPLLKYVLPRLLTPYIAHFVTDYDITDYHISDLNINVTPHFELTPQNSQKVIETLGSQIVTRLDRLFIDYTLSDFANQNSPASILLKSEHIAEDLYETASELNMSAPESLYTSQKRDIVITCNEANEVILQSTNKYRRIDVPGFENKPFKVGILSDKYLVYVTPVMKHFGNFLISVKDASMFGFMGLSFNYDYGQNYEIIWGTSAIWYRKVDPRHHKMVYFK